MGQRATLFGSSARYRLFAAVKYGVYVLLCLNVFLFLQEELLALEHTFAGGIAAGQLVQVFSATLYRVLPLSCGDACALLGGLTCCCSVWMSMRPWMRSTARQPATSSTAWRASTS